MQHSNRSQKGRKNVDLVDPLTIATELRDRDAVDLVRDALDHGRCAMAFQPIVQADRAHNPAFYEGLIRVSDQTGRYIPAKDFIDAVEMDELGRRLDCEALRIGVDTLTRVPDLRLSINMSARSIGYKPWARILHRALRRDETIGERLILEITERSAIVMPEIVQSFMSEFQQFGVCFALDDFGAGYTSFRYLRDFFFDIIKIDGQFIRGVHTSPDDQALVRALVAVAKHFDMLTVAEFVEAEEDANILMAMGVDCLQGYYFGQPTMRPYWDNQGQRAAG